MNRRRYFYGDAAHVDPEALAEIQERTKGFRHFIGVDVLAEEIASSVRLFDEGCVVFFGTKESVTLELARAATKRVRKNWLAQFFQWGKPPNVESSTELLTMEDLRDHDKVFFFHPQEGGWLGHYLNPRN